MSQLKKCLQVPEEQLPLEDLDIKEDLSYAEYQSRFWKLQNELLRTKELECVKYNGIIIRKMKLPGKEKITLKQNFHISLV